MITLSFPGTSKIWQSFAARASSITDGFKCSSTCRDSRLWGEWQEKKIRTVDSFGGSSFSHLWPINFDVGGGGRGPMKPAGRLGFGVRSKACWQMFSWSFSIAADSEAGNDMCDVNLEDEEKIVGGRALS